MVEIKFSGLGTHWQIIIDSDSVSPSLKEEIKIKVSSFEKKFSRFIDESEIGKINKQGQGTYQISDELAQALKFGIELSANSEGHFNPTVGSILSAYGYNKELKFNTNADQPITDSSIVLNKNTLSLSGNGQIDLGGWGKGYLIDKIYDFLVGQKIEHFIINGGGDFRATSKQNNTSWKVAIEHPLENDLSIGIVELKDLALANSGRGKRKAGVFHHLIDFKTGKPTNSLLASHVISPTVEIADGLATALFISPSEVRHMLSEIYPIQYLLVNEKLIIQRSRNFILQ